MAYGQNAVNLAVRRQSATAPYFCRGQARDHPAAGPNPPGRRLMEPVNTSNPRRRPPSTKPGLLANRVSARRCSSVPGALQPHCKRDCRRAPFGLQFSFSAPADRDPHCFGALKKRNAASVGPRA
jgi:hypothetical protein